MVKCEVSCSGMCQHRVFEVTAPSGGGGEEGAEGLGWMSELTGGRAQGKGLKWPQGPKKTSSWPHGHCLALGFLENEQLFSGSGS